MTRDTPGVASLWMIAVALVLYFLPFVGGLLGGIVGGHRAGSVNGAVAAAIFALMPVSIGLFVLYGPLDAPLMGRLASVAPLVLVLLADSGLLIGATIGGYLDEQRWMRAR